MLTEADWVTLVNAVSRGTCTPFLGSGVSAPNVPLGSSFARLLAERFSYPMTDVWNLPRVTQFIATTYDPQFAKGQVADLIVESEHQPLDFSDREQPHRVLADLRLPLYLTTNYDRFMTLALESVGAEVRTEISRWNYDTRRLPPLDMEFSPDRPLVYHFHGVATNIASILVTEDDYVDFLMEAQADLNQVIPPAIQGRLATTSLLFVGYSLHDWNFRVLMRSIMSKLEGKSAKRKNISVQLRPDDQSISPDRRQEAEQFLIDYLRTEQVNVHWGNAREFLVELRRRWEATRPAAVR